MYKLFANPGWGSVLVEAQLAWYGLPYETEDVGDIFQSAAARDRLKPYNQIHQVPTLILRDGAVMTESAAITLHLADVAASSELVPAATEGVRPQFLRWLVYLVANIYPCFTYADDPSRFVTDEAEQERFRQKVDAYQKRLWTIVEEQAQAPRFFGPRFTALDIFIGAMTHWRPRRAWFEGNAPKLLAIAREADKVEKLATVWRRNFPEGS
jgi:GST-like protein